MSETEQQEREKIISKSKSVCKRRAFNYIYVAKPSKNSDDLQSNPYEQPELKLGENVQHSGKCNDLTTLTHENTSPRKRKKKKHNIEKATGSSGSDGQLNETHSGVSDEVKRKKKRKKKKKKKYYDLLAQIEEEAVFLEKNKYYDLLAEIEEEDALLKESEQKVKTLKILIPFILSESHTIETHLSRPPAREERELLQQLNVQTQYKKFSPEEDAVIHQNWKQFSEEYEFTGVRPFLLLDNLKPSQRKNFVRYLGHGLHHRTLYSIYARFLVLYRSCKKGSFSEEEDEIIWFHLSNGKNEKAAFSTVSKLLHRERHAVYARYRRLVASAPDRTERYKWNLNTCQIVVTALLKIANVKKVKHLRDRHITSTEWKLVGEECKIRPRRLREFWKLKLSTMLFATEPLHLNQIRIKIIQRLYKSHVEWWQDIVWTDLAKDFDGVSSMFLWKVFRTFLKPCYPNKSWKDLYHNFRAIVKDLKKKYIPILRSRQDYRLKRLRMGQDGKLYFLKE